MFTEQFEQSIGAAALLLLVDCAENKMQRAERRIENGDFRTATNLLLDVSHLERLCEFQPGARGTSGVIRSERILDEEED